MGQYYKPIMKCNNQLKILNRNVIIDGEEKYTFAKLTEHSWIGNFLLDTVCNQIYNSETPSRVIWMGDYGNEFADNLTENFNGLSKTLIKNYHRAAWRGPERGRAIEPVEFEYNGKYILNHTKKEYLDFSLYYQMSVMHSCDEEWCLHPLSLLTCIGNGLGGGDYKAPTEESTFNLIGYWAWDEISITDKKPTGYNLIQPIFKELGWE